MDWANKWIALPYHNTCVLLQGILPKCLVGTIIQVCLLNGEGSSKQPIAQFSEIVQVWIQQFSSVFEPPKGLPPICFCDHKIPLIEGAQPVSVRPYRYPPALKDEIE